MKKLIPLLLLTIPFAYANSDDLVNVKLPKHVNPDGTVSSGETVRVGNPVNQFNGSVSTGAGSYSGSTDTYTPTAYEQGLGKPNKEDVARQQARYEEQNLSPRALGIQVVVPSDVADAVGKQKRYKGYVNKWVKRLAKYGVTKQKVRFEANRLTKEDFEDWALRLEAGAKQNGQ